MKKKHRNKRFLEKMHKKGIEWMSAETSGIILAIMIFLFLFAFCSKLYGVVFPKEIDQATEGNFNTLTAKIQELLDDEEEFSITTPYYINKDYVLIGFDKEWSEQLSSVESSDYFELLCRKGDSFSTEKLSKLIKPAICKSKACLCLYNKEFIKVESKKTKTFKSSPIICQTFDNDFFLSLATSYLSKTQRSDTALMYPTLSPIITNTRLAGDFYYSYLFNCNDNVQTLYVEKIKDSDKTYILVVNKKGKEVTDRIKEVKDYFTICSDDSVKNCQGKKLNSACEQEDIACTGESICKREQTGSDECICQCFPEIITRPLSTTWEDWMI